MNPEIRRRIVIALYLAASLAAATLAPGFRHDLVWIPGLAWAANILIVLAAIALARARAPLRLQLALAFAAPGLHVVLLLGRAAYSGQAGPFDEPIMILGLLLGWTFHSEFLGSVLAFAISLAFHRTSQPTETVARQPVFSGIFGALGWVCAAAWLYMLGLGVISTYLERPRPPVEALLTWIFGAAAMVGWYVSPLWIVGAIALLLSSGIRNQRPAVAHMAPLLLVLCLIGVYVFLEFQD